MDRNVLVQRGALDIVAILFPFHQSFLLQADLCCVLTAALHTLLKRDVSLSRRLYVWLLGSQVLKSSLVNSMQSPTSAASNLLSTPEGDRLAQNLPDVCNLAYFERYARLHLNFALRGILTHAVEAAQQGSVKAECVLPYRLLRALLDKSEISSGVMDDVMLDLVMCLQAQIEALGGISSTPQGKDVGGALSKSKSSSLVRDNASAAKKLGKKGSLKADIVQSANLLFGSLSQEFVWGWMAGMLKQYLRGDASPDRSRRKRGGGGEVGRDEERPVVKPVPQSPEGKGKDLGDTDQRQSLDLRTLLSVVMFVLRVVFKVS